MFEGDPFKGKTWAITGAVPGMTRSEAFAELKKRGAKATKSVSSKTDVLVSQGYDPGDRVRLSNKEIKARQNDIPIINEKQFLALLKGEALEAVESMAPVAKPRKTVSTTDALVGFREIVHDEPSIKTWNTICELVDACEPDDLPVVIDYLDGHLSSWPVTYDVNYAEYYRSGMLSLPLSWRRETFQGINSPKLRLVRTANFHGAQMTGKVGLKVLACDQLNQARKLDLGRNKLSGAFFKALRAAESMRHLTHIYLGDATLSAGACKGLVGDAVWAPTALGLNRASLKKDGLRILLSSPIWATLKELHLSGVGGYGSDDKKVAAALAAASHINGAIERLALNYNSEMTVEGFEALWDGGRFPQLSWLNLTSCQLSDRHLEILAEATHLTNLRFLDVEDTHGGGPAIGRLLQAPHLEKLDTLHISGRHGAIAALAKSRIQPQELVVVYGFSDHDAVLDVLASDVLKRTTKLRFRMEGSYDGGVASDNHALSLKILAHPAMQGVEELYLGDAMISDEHLKLFLNSEHLGALKTMPLNTPYNVNPLSDKLLKQVGKAPHLHEMFRQRVQREAKRLKRFPRPGEVPSS